MRKIRQGLLKFNEIEINEIKQGVVSIYNRVNIVYNL